MIHGSSPWGFPHSEICGSMLISSSPQLIAGCRVLLRLSVPRHSSYALFRLNSFAFRSLLNKHRYLLWASQIIVFGLCKHVYTVTPPPTFRLWRIVVSHKYWSERPFSFKKSFSIYNYLFRFCFFIRFSMIICFTIPSYEGTVGGLKWTRTTDLALIRRAL